MLRDKFEPHWTLAGVGIIVAATPRSRNVFVAIIAPEFDENTRMTFDTFRTSS